MGNKTQRDEFSRLVNELTEGQLRIIASDYKSKNGDISGTYKAWTDSNECTVKRQAA